MLQPPGPVILKSAHDERLQSLRGMTALLVMFGHSRLCLEIVSKIFVLGGLFPPHSAVMFFYVLSGFVLGESFRRIWGTSGPTTAFARYVLKRMMRLFPVFWVAVFVGAGAYLLLEHAPIPGVSDWLGGAFRGASAVTWQNITPNLLFQRVYMNGALWSVQVEVFIIPFLPLLVLLSQRLSLAADIAFLGALSIVAYLLMMGSTHGTPASFVAYLSFFYIGVILPKLMASRARGFLASGVVFGVAACSIFYLGMVYPSLGIAPNGKLLIDMLLSAEVIAFVLLNRDSAVSRLLLWRPLVWLGDISYSFYAYGTPILMVVALTILSRCPPEWLTQRSSALLLTAVIAISATLVTLPIAWISYRYIERPCIRLGAAVIARFRARQALPANAKRPAPAGAEAGVQ